MQSKLTNAKHIAFAYSYYYLINALYRCCKYDGTNFKQPEIRHMLGYNDKNSNLDAITKPDGILDQLGYTKYIRDFPIAARLNFNFLEFEMFSDIKKEHCNIPHIKINNYKVKYPLKAFYRTQDSLADHIYDGTYYDISNTHGLTIGTFDEMMHNKEIGTVGFYIFGYLRHMNNLYKSGYQRSFPNLVLETGITNRTLYKYLKKLEEKLFITIERQNFILGLPEEDRIANTYTTIV